MDLPDPTTCHKCRQKPGERIPYYYGRAFWDLPNLTPQYEIAGESEDWLCAVCAKEAPRRLRTLLIVGGIATSLALFGTGIGLVLAVSSFPSVGLGQPELWAFLMSPAGVSLGLLSTWLQWRRHRHLGYVLNHVLPVLKQQGHNVILAPEEYDKLLAQGRVRRVPQGL